jgi:hypothetical protein
MPAPPALDTPASATFPSELKSAVSHSPPPNIKHEEPQKTPLTPPAAYLDFLAKRSSRNISPPASATFSSVLLEKPSLTSNPSTDSVATEATVQTLSTDAESNPAETPAPDPPARTESPDSQSSVQSITASTSKDVIAESSSSKVMARIDTSFRPRRISTGPISPFGAMPDSARTPRRLCIPQSPYSPRVQSPLTPGGAVGVVSPVNSMMSPATLMSPAGNMLYSPYSATLSPMDSMDSPRNLTLKHVVTRTVTIARPPAPIMEPVPASKKRRIEGPTTSA